MNRKLPSLLLLLIYSLSRPAVSADSNRNHLQAARQNKTVQEEETTEPPRTSVKEKKLIRSSLMAIGRANDAMAAEVEKYGTVSVSSPLLTLPTKRLWFQLNNTADTYYSNARTEVAGRALAVTAIQQSLGVGVEAGIDLDQLNIAKAITSQIAPDLAFNREQERLQQKQAQLAYERVKRSLPAGASEEDQAANEEQAIAAKRKVLDEPLKPRTVERPASSETTQPAPGTAASVSTVTTQNIGPDGKPIADENAATGTTVTTNLVANTPAGAPRVDPALVAFAAIADSQTAIGNKGKTLLGGDIKLPDLDAVKAAEAAHSLQGLMNFFHYPQEAMQFRDKTVMMAAVAVSVAPGWRTARDFAGEVVMMNSYEWVRARRTTVARMVADPDLPLRVREQLARDYQLPWEGQKEAAERAMVTLKIRYEMATAEKEIAPRIMEEASAAAAAARSKLKVIDEKIQALPPPVRKSPTAQDASTGAQVRSVLLDEQARTAMELRAAQARLTRAENAIETYVATKTEYMLAERQQGKEPVRFNTANLPMTYGAGPAGGGGSAQGWPVSSADRKPGDPRFLAGKPGNMVTFNEIPIDLRFTDESVRATTPLVSGISPLSQSDTLDLASEFRRQDQFALALAVALRQQGAKGEAKVFEQFVKNQRKDVQTRSVSATVATYSRAGGVVGFEIGPRLRALADPASRKNESAFVLERQSFPALLVFGIDAQDIYPRIAWSAEHLEVWEPKLKTVQHTYWHPLTYRFKGPRDYFNPFKTIWPPIWWEAHQNQQGFVSRSLRLHDAHWDAKERLSPMLDEEDRDQEVIKEASALFERGQELKMRYLGAYNSQWLPAEMLVPSDKLTLPESPAVPVIPAINTIVPPVVQVTAQAAAATPVLTQPVLAELMLTGPRLEYVDAVEAQPAGIITVATRGVEDDGRQLIVREGSVYLRVMVIKAGIVSLKLRLRAGAYGPPPISGPESLYSAPVEFKVVSPSASNNDPATAIPVRGLAAGHQPTATMLNGEATPQGGGWPRATAVRPALQYPVFPDELPTLITGRE